MAGSVFGLICGLLAIKRNRGAVMWFMLGLIFGPIALLWVALQQRRDEPAFL